MEILDIKNKQFHLLSLFCFVIFFSAWSMVKSVEEKIADVVRNQTSDVRQDIAVLKFKIDSLDNTGSKDILRLIDDFKDLQERLKYIERKQQNPFKRN